jgi:hypothetical protein
MSSRKYKRKSPKRKSPRLRKRSDRRPTIFPNTDRGRLIQHRLTREAATVLDRLKTPSKRVIYSSTKTAQEKINEYFFQGGITLRGDDQRSSIDKRVGIKERCCITHPFAKLYVLGDMEGNINQLFQWFIHKRLINENLDWIADDDTYVIQCGDQVDSIRFDEESKMEVAKNSAKKDIDIAVPMFLEYMNYISNDHVLSVIGNHEWMNVYKDFHYSGKDIDVDERSSQFSYDGIVGKILRRRNFIIQFNNCIISHAGVCPANIEKYNAVIRMMNNDKKQKFILQTFLKTINKESSDKTNYDTVKNSSRMFRYVIHGEKHPYGYDGIIWNRHFFDITENDNYKGEKIETPKELKGFTQIKGHDKGSDIWFCNNNENETQCSKQPRPELSKKLSIITVDTVHAYDHEIVNVFIEFDADSKIDKVRSETFKCRDASVPFTIKHVVQKPSFFKHFISFW